MLISDNCFEILIVDDDKVICFLEERILLKLGLQVPILSFQNGEDALVHIEEPLTRNKPLLILLDINMPNMDGWEFLERVQKIRHPERVWVIMVSSAISKEEKDKASSYPQVIAYQEKPLMEDSVRALLDEEPLRSLQELCLQPI